ncbi:MAG TPA: helix-turn-helix transcriptional regulator [Conexibacter sp.]
MSFQNAVLGLVIEQPGYGYELAQRVNARVPVPVSVNAVYPALLQLEGKGWVRRREATAQTSRNQITFDPTAAGREAFDAWMDEPSPPLRGALRWKIVAASFEKLSGLIEETRVEEQACLDRIELLTGDTDVLIDPVAEWAPIGRLLLRRTDVKELQIKIESLQEVRAEMKRVLRLRARLT